MLHCLVLTLNVPVLDIHTNTQIQLFRLNIQSKYDEKMRMSQVRVERVRKGTSDKIMVSVAHKKQRICIMWLNMIFLQNKNYVLKNGISKVF